GTSWSGQIKAVGEESIFTLFTGAIVVVNEGGSQTLTIANQSLVVTSFSSPPSVPFILTGEQLFNIYGDALRLTNPDWFDDEDNFDLDKIAPEAGSRRADHGGGAGFDEAAVQLEAGGVDIGGLLGSGDLLDGTQLSLDNFESIEELVGMGPQTKLSVNAIIDPESGNLQAFEVVISLDQPAQQPVTITYEIRPGTATATDTGLPGDVDFIGSGTGTLIIPTGEMSGSFSVGVVDDDVIEGLEVFIVQLTGADFADISPAFSSAVVVIQDDDIGIVSLGNITAGGVAASGNVISVNEDAGSVSIELVLDKALAPGVDLDIDYVITGSATQGTDYTTDAVQTATFSGGTTGLQPGAIVSIVIPIVDDGIFEPAESLTITLLSGSSNVVIDGSVGPITINIDDDELPLGFEETEIVSLQESVDGVEVENASLGVTGGSGTYTGISFDAVQSDFEALGLTSGGVPVLLSIPQANVLVGTVGGESLFTVTLNADGTYSMSLSGAIDHIGSGGELLSQIGFDLAFTAIDENGSTAAGVIPVVIVDDVPIAMPDEIELLAPELSAYDIVFVIDVSGSMLSLVAGGTGNRIDAVKQAFSSVLDEYAAMSRAVNINIIAFASASSVVFSGISIADAQAFINDPSNLVPDGTTNYAAAVADDANGAQGVLEDNLANSDISGFNQVVYFASDGAPSTGSGVPTDGGNQWQQFVDSNDIEVVAVGIGSGTDTVELANVENFGEAPIVVTDPNDLEATLVGNIPVVEVDNVVTSGSIDLPGADGGTLTSLVYDAVSYDVPLNGDSLEVTTNLGGMISINMLGDYVYTAPQTATPGTIESFEYFLTDGDGDVSSAVLSITFIENNAGSLQASSAFAPLDGAGFDGLFEGTGADDILIGTLGNDLLQGNGGNDTLTGGEGADSFVFTAEDAGLVHITDFDLDQDTIDLDQIFDSIGLTLEQQAGALTVSEINGMAALTIAGAEPLTIFFDNFISPDQQVINDIANSLRGDES
ncbi:MAG: hypothetical protein COB93_11240, partial [Sneathiella sp.]